MSRVEEIRARRAALIERTATERERVTAQFAPFRPPLALVERSIAAGRVILSHPEWIAGAAALILILRPRRALAWAQRGFLAWRAWQWIAQTARKTGVGKLA